MKVEQARFYLQGLVINAINFAHMVAGINAGLFDAIAGFGEEGVTWATLAKALNYDEDYVRFWCETAYANQVLDIAGGGHFRLGAGFEGLLTSGTSICNTLRGGQLYVEERLEFPHFLKSGEVRTYGDHGERLSRLVADMSQNRGKSAVENIYKRFDEVDSRLRSGARLLDVGCGAADLLVTLANEYPEASFVGVDGDEIALGLARRAVEAENLAKRVTFQHLTAEALEFEREFDIVSLFNVMHELRADIRPRALRNLWQALTKDGILTSTDFDYPDKVEELRKPENFFAVIEQSTEVVWGNRLLSEERLKSLLTECGFGPIKCQAVNLPGELFARHVALAWKSA